MKEVKPVSHSKHGIFIAMLLVSAQLHAAGDMPPFERMRQLYRESNDPTRLSYVYRRCAALQLNLSAFLVRKKEVKAADDYEKLAQHYMLLSENIDIEVDSKRGVKASKTMETVNLSVKHLTEQYGDRMRANYQKRGEYFAGDAMLESELTECLKPEVLTKSFGR